MKFPFGARAFSIESPSNARTFRGAFSASREHSFRFNASSFDLSMPIPLRLNAILAVPFSISSLSHCACVQTAPIIRNSISSEARKIQFFQWICGLPSRRKRSRMPPLRFFPFFRTPFRSLYFHPNGFSVTRSEQSIRMETGELKRFLSRQFPQEAAQLSSACHAVT